MVKTNDDDDDDDDLTSFMVNRWSPLDGGW